MKKYKEHQLKIGDGKLPNNYWLFHYDEKFKITKENGFNEVVPLDDKEHDGGLIGKYKTYKLARQAADWKAYYPHVFIEDRLSGQVFETICIVCQECGKEEWESREDIKYTQKAMEEKGVKFE